MDDELSTELQRGPIYRMVLFFEGHLFKALRSDVFVPFRMCHVGILSKVGASAGQREVYWQLPYRRDMDRVLVTIVNIG
jgi:hypothetical protein